MNKIALIIKREYISRVKKKTFIIMSIIGPILFAGLMVAPALLASLEDKDVKKVAVIDETTIFTSYASQPVKSVIPDEEYLKFIALPDTDLETIRENFDNTGYYAVLYIPENIINAERAILYSTKQPSLDVSSHIRNALEREIKDMKLVAHDIDNLDEILQDVQTNVDINNIKWTKDGEAKKSNTGLVMGIGYASGLLIYMFIFIYGAMIMRGVIEEKTSRIVEVIISSVKPFQLMMGKIIGVGMVGLTQFILWIVLTLVLVTGITAAMGVTGGTQDMPAQVSGTELFADQPEVAGATEQMSEGQEIIVDLMGSLESIEPVKILGAFLFYFLFGYLMYGSLFAVVGSAVDNETETQQFMLPITIPLILSIVLMANVMSNPDGPLAFWFSMIPFTSPVIMMVRMPFDVPTWEILLSGAILILSILGAIWVAGKIYRTGILMYGKKVTYKELWKWLKYNN
ncbi:MAG TPA: ABC transporter permease [Bacteroidales bacterium]|nr:ABC transporter permease [Bacteroidales bacterium]